MYVDVIPPNVEIQGLKMLTLWWFVLCWLYKPYWCCSARGYNWATLFLGDINTGTWPSRLGESQMRQVKCGLEFCGTLTKEWLLWQGPEAIIQKITDPSSRQRGCYKITNPQLFQENFKEKVKLVAGPRWAPDTKTDWPTVGRNVTSTSKGIEL
jgi:hypothetical protein